MAKTLTTLRKELSLSDAANVRAMAAMFAKIAESNPEAVKAVFNRHMRSLSDDRQNQQVEFYADQAKMFADMFDLD